MAADVIVEVQGGVAYVSVRKGSGITVELIDYDNEPNHPEPDLSAYEDARLPLGPDAACHDQS